MFIFISSPEFNSNLLYKKESSNIYDSKGDLIATIGTEKRQIVSYDELPQTLVDAIIATEDSRFFEHNGLDIPRFVKAGSSYLLGPNIGGASTLTMQLSKFECKEPFFKAAREFQKIRHNNYKKFFSEKSQNNKYSQQ